MGRQNIVLDIDETLLHTYIDAAGWYEVQPLANPDLYPIRDRIYHKRLMDVGEKTGSGDLWEFWGILRPHVHAFLDYCLDRFEHVIIWSAGQPEYVRYVTDALFHLKRRDPRLILSWDHCRVDPGSQSYDKPLEILHKYDSAITLQNTFLVDDRMDNYLKSNPFNGILIPPFEPQVTELLAKDNALLTLRNYFERPDVKAAKDVRQLDKTIVWG